MAISLLCMFNIRICVPNLSGLPDSDFQSVGIRDPEDPSGIQGSTATLIRTRKHSDSKVTVEWPIQAHWLLCPDAVDGWLSSDADAIPIPSCQRQSCGRRVHSWSASREILCLPDSPQNEASRSPFTSDLLSRMPPPPHSSHYSLIASTFSALRSVKRWTL